MSYAGKPRIDAQHPLVLALSCQKRWYQDMDYMQRYAIVVTVRHSGGIDLYNGIKQSMPSISEVKKVSV